MSEIERICKKHKLSHGDLAKMLSCHRDHIQKMNTNKRTITIATKERIEMIDIKLSDLKNYK